MKGTYYLIFCLPLLTYDRFDIHKVFSSLIIVGTIIIITLAARFLQILNSCHITARHIVPYNITINKGFINKLCIVMDVFWGTNRLT